MTIISKKQMSEEDIKLQYITPAITAKWDIKKITMETNITDGKINLKGNFITREKPKRADYVLYLNPNNPIAIVEAKDNKHSISHGLQQAMAYASMLDIPFAYSSNGDGFFEHDFLTGKERELDLDEFPTEEELYCRYKNGANNGEGLSENQEKMIQQPYYSSQKTYPPRYYQRIAINRTVDAISMGKDRLLLVMATGTGKTYTAFQIVYRLLKSGMKSKILYLADRNNLVDQSIQQDFAPLEKVIHKVNFSKDDPSTITSYQVYFSLYQQLAGGNDDQEEDINNTILKLKQLFRPDFFDLIIVDECHRGSAKKESNWRKILEYFASATQIGMTATPKETKYISNIDYFGEPIYTYSLKEGIEDGFLAPFKVINVMTDIGEGWRPRKGQWFYRLDMPEGYKHFSKTKPMKLEHFAPAVEWWKNRQEIQEDGFDKAKKYSIDEIKEKNYNIDLCGYPHEEEEILPPKELIQQYQEKRASLNADIDRILAQITDILGINLEEN